MDFIFNIFSMSRRKVWVLFLMIPTILFILEFIVGILLSMFVPSIKANITMILIIFTSLLILSILVFLPLGIIKTVNSEWAFSIWEINRFSRAETKKKFLMFFLFILTYLAINIVLWEVLDPESTDPMISSIGWMVSLFVSIFFTLGVTNVSLIAVSWHKLRYVDLFNKIKYFLHFLVSYVIYIIIVVCGFVLFIVPWIYRATRFSFYQYLIIDKNYGPIKALKESRAITKWKFRDVFAYNMILWFINLLGMLCAVVGLLWTVPMTMIAKAKMYKELSK